MKDEVPEGQPAPLRRDLLARTKQYALRIIRLYSSLPHNSVAQTLGRQILKSGTSPGAHYREAQRAKPSADFISKVEGALQELDETGYWLELLVGSGTIKPEAVDGLDRETDELSAIFTSIVKSVKSQR
jgi:four helix bundle protein